MKQYDTANIEGWFVFVILWGFLWILLGFVWLVGLVGCFVVCVLFCFTLRCTCKKTNQSNKKQPHKH